MPSIRIHHVAILGISVLLMTGLTLAHTPLGLQGEPSSASMIDASAASPALDHPGMAEATSSSGPNGYVMMVHGAADPNPNSVSPVFIPPGHEAVMATLQGDQIQIHAIPYTVEEGLPVEVLFPELEVIDAATGERVTFQPNAPAEESTICEEETGLPGHEGPIEACLVFHIPAEELAGWNVVTLRLNFADETGISHTETYSAVSHYLLHASMESGEDSLRDEADNRTDPTPFLIEDQVDIVP